MGHLDPQNDQLFLRQGAGGERGLSNRKNMIKKNPGCKIDNGKIVVVVVVVVDVVVVVVDVDFSGLDLFIYHFVAR